MAGSRKKASPMSDTARERILDRLRRAPRQELPRPAAPATAAAPERGAMVARLKSLMEAMRAEVHVVPAAQWLPPLKKILTERSIQTLLYGPGSGIGSELRAAWEADASGLPELVPYGGPVETFKDQLFAVDAAVTTAAGAVADTGAIILRPDPHEPRLMSLVPPVHIALLPSAAIFPSLGEAMREGRWSADMPTNLLLISGPSKTADIELTLAFGVHGPKELIVLILES
jgi:L-lactate dehydrogenase complex protein LldG